MLGEDYRKYHTVIWEKLRAILAKLVVALKRLPTAEAILGIMNMVIALEKLELK